MRQSIVILVLVGCLVVGCTVFCAIPKWSDLIQKDYCVYIGAFTVEYRGHDEYVEFGDVFVWGGGSLEEGTHTGTVVYSKRSRILLAVYEEEVR